MENEEWREHVITMNLELNKYLKNKRPIFPDMREGQILTRGQRKRQEKELGDGILYGIDTWRLKEDSKQKNYFVQEWRSRCKINPKFKGLVKYVEEGPRKGFKEYHCTLEDLHDDLIPFYGNLEDDSHRRYHKELIEVFHEKRQQWLAEGKFVMQLMRHVFALDMYIADLARVYAEEELFFRNYPAGEIARTLDDEHAGFIQMEDAEKSLDAELRYTESVQS